MPANWLVVGAGFTGAILAERLASQCGAKVLVVDRRSHVAGNAFDTRSPDGVLHHVYGPHIFHTSAPQVVDYLSQFTHWRPYEHRVLGLVEGKLVPIPFNLTSLSLLFPAPEASRLSSLLIETYGLETRVPILKMRSSTNAAIRALADFIYENIFLHYTTKQWGLLPEELLPSVTARVPVSISHDDRYFQDAFQFMPGEGYARLFERLLSHPNIRVELSTNYGDAQKERFDGIIHTGAIDEFFDFVLGALPYRSMRFDLGFYPQRQRQPVGTLNYPTTEKFTRSTEMGHLTGEWGESTAILIEHPEPHRPGVTEPHYPIPRSQNQALHGRYIELARREAPNVFFAGRLGDYRYYNMDQASARALSLFRRLAARF